MRRQPSYRVNWNVQALKSVEQNIADSKEMNI